MEDLNENNRAVRSPARYVSQRRVLAMGVGAALTVTVLGVAGMADAHHRGLAQASRQTNRRHNATSVPTRCDDEYRDDDHCSSRHPRRQQSRPQPLLR